MNGHAFPGGSQHLLLDVQADEVPVGLEALRRSERVVAGTGNYLEDPLPRADAELAQKAIGPGHETTKL